MELWVVVVYLSYEPFWTDLPLAQAEEHAVNNGKVMGLIPWECMNQ